MPKQVVIIFGPPGAGKGTQSELLSDKLGYFYFETSKALEKAFNSDDKKDYDIEGEIYTMAGEKQKWKTGELMSPPFVTQIVKENITSIFNEGKSLIMAGSPRTLYEVEREMPFLDNLYGKENVRIILLDVGAEETISRNSHRKICELMRHSILFNNETENLTICPLDGSKLVKRIGLDDAETIKVRLKEYAERTLPMIEYFEKNNYKVNRIDGGQSVAEVFDGILQIVQ